MIDLKILYRGSLSSCNYGCLYCPFAKRKNSRAELALDRQELERFVSWIVERPEDRFSILFTPWGEALIRSWYRQAIQRLSHLPHVGRVAIQTNLSCSLKWLEECGRERVALWATYHPDWVELERFLAKCLYLHQQGIRYSVGVVGFPRFKAQIATLRARLPPSVYLWINAVKAELPHMAPADLDFFALIDPLFPYNTHYYPSRGRACAAGEQVISVAGDGTVRRCHFIPTPIGNLYDPAFERCLRPRPCTKEVCHCHIGYVHMPHLGLDTLFGTGILERIPAHLPTQFGGAVDI